MTKFLSLEMTIFSLKMVVKSGLDFFFEIARVPSEIPANQPGLSGQIFLHWAAATLKGHVEFQNIFF